jgi:hypothetical protein
MKDEWYLTVLGIAGAVLVALLLGQMISCDRYAACIRHAKDAALCGKP